MQRFDVPEEFSLDSREWNAWRASHPDARARFVDVVIEDQDLSGRDLHRADLRGAILRHVERVLAPLEQMLEHLRGPKKPFYNAGP